MMRMLISIFRLRPVELLKSEKVGEKPPRANWVLAVLGALILAAAYYLAVMVIDPMSALVLFFFAVVSLFLCGGHGDHCNVFPLYRRIGGALPAAAEAERILL